MRKYTIIYTGTVGFARNGTKFDRVETNNLKHLLSQDKYSGGGCGESLVSFVFEGWPILAGEFDIPVPAPAIRRVNILGIPK